MATNTCAANSPHILVVTSTNYRRKAFPVAHLDETSFQGLSLQSVKAEKKGMKEHEVRGVYPNLASRLHMLIP